MLLMFALSMTDWDGHELMAGWGKSAESSNRGSKTVVGLAIAKRLRRVLETVGAISEHKWPAISGSDYNITSL